MAKKPSYKELENEITSLRKKLESHGDAGHLVNRKQNERLETIGSLAGGIAHEFNNILGIIIGNIELASDNVTKWSPAYPYLTEVWNTCIRARNFVKQIIAFNHQSDSVLAPLDISLVVKESLKMLRSVIPTTIEIHQDISESLDTINGNPAEIKQILLNLCANAVDAMKGTGGTLGVGLENTELADEDVAETPELKPGPHIKLSVSDTGSGIDPAVIEQIFDPYFTTKSKDDATGIGLSVVQGIVKHHSGAIRVESPPDGGTRFSMLIPSISGESEPEILVDDRIPKGDEQILFVDDEPVMVKAYQAMLELLGYKVYGRASSIEALSAFKAQPGKFDLVITDQQMPDLSGLMLAKEMMAIRPDIPVILCTGYSDLVDEDEAKEAGIKAFVMKPMALAEIADTIRNVLDRRK
ncbi:MAG: response regulator [Desulfobacterales bacterium]